MKNSANEFTEGKEEVLHIDALDLVHHLVALIRLGKMANWMEIYMQPQTLVIHGAEEVDGLSATCIEIMHLIRKRTACGYKTVIIWRKEAR